MKKRFLAVLGGAMMLMSCAALAEGTVTELEEGHDPVKIGWLQKNQSNPFELVINDGGEAVLEEAKERGIVSEY